MFHWTTGITCHVIEDSDEVGLDGAGAGGTCQGFLKRTRKIGVF